MPKMAIKIGEVAALSRYPVKSMRGEPLEVADLGWHGLDVTDAWPSVEATIAEVSPG
jgi:uncharacterized protein YcbX